MAGARTVLVPLDGSELAEYAVPVAREIARRRGASLRLVHVNVAVPAEPIYVEGLPLLDEHLRPRRREHEQAYLERARARLADDIPGGVDILDEPVVPALCRHVTRTGAELVVMTTHARGGFERLWLGSVADDLVRRCPVPILLLRPHENGQPPVSFRRVVVPLDGSPLAETILEHALALVATEKDPEVVLLRVVEPFAPRDTEAGLVPSEDDIEAGIGRAREYLDRVARGLSRRSVTVRSCVPVNKRVARTILEAVRDMRADAVALATHGRTGLAQVRLGSVADKLIRASDVPLLIHRPVAAS
jgi:nucleotide-binding universal stress UspA family protein